MNTKFQSFVLNNIVKLKYFRACYIKFVKLIAEKYIMLLVKKDEN